MSPPIRSRLEQASTSVRPFFRWLLRSVLPHAGLTIAILLFVHALLPPFWGSPGLALKVRSAEMPVRPYARVLVGSSHLFRQVIPSMLDSALADGGRTFNMALNAVYSPESEIACAHLLRSERPPAEVILEVMPYVVFEEQSFEHYRSWYYVDAAACWSLVREHANLPGVPFMGRLGTILPDLRAFACAATMPGLADRLNDDDLLDTGIVLGPLKDGHVPFAWQQQRDPENKGLQRRHEELLADTAEIGRRAAAILKAQHRDPRPSGSAHAQALRGLLRLAEQRGVRLRFVLPPLWPVKDEDVVALVRSLPQERCIDLSDPARYPEFYRLENIFDAGHLNATGSRFFTLRLADQLKGPGPETGMSISTGDMDHACLRGQPRSPLKITLRAAPGSFATIRRCSTLTERPAMRGFRVLSGREIPPARFQKQF